MDKGKSTVMDAIGGYFELDVRIGEHYHNAPLPLNRGRNCFEFIFLARKYTKVYIPYYRCEVMLQPLHRHHIAYEFYHINENLEREEMIQLRNDEAFLYTNYFGLKQSCVESLASIYKKQLIVDNAQAFFAPRTDGIDTFYSPRKFVGVPDGGYLYTDAIIEHDFPMDQSYDRMFHLLLRIEEGAEKGYSFFRKADDSLNDLPIRKMSVLTDRILRNIDYESIKRQRRKNFETLQKKLCSSNRYSWKLSDDTVPMVYPYYTTDKSLRNHLITNKVFVATYWPNVLEWCSLDFIEYKLTENIIPVPIDQRYGIKEMNKIVEIIKIVQQ